MTPWKRLLRVFTFDKSHGESPPAAADSRIGQTEEARAGGIDTEVLELLADFASDDEHRNTNAFSKLKRRAEARDSGLVEPLITALRHPAGPVRSLAANLLGMIGQQRAASLLLPLLEDPYWSVRYEAIDALGKLQTRESIIPIINCVGKESNFRVRGKGLQVLENVFHFTDQKIIGHIQALWRENNIDLNDLDSGFEAPAIPQAPQEDARAVYRRDDPYVEECYAFNFQEGHEERNWRTIPELSEIPQLVSNGDLDRAQELLAAALRLYSDYDFVHYWYGDVQGRRGDHDKERAAFLNGLEKSKKRQSLCGDVGMWEFRHGQLRDAVKWWVRSVVIQAQAGRIGDVQSALRLSYVAKMLGDHEAADRLHEVAGQGPHGVIALTPQGQQEIAERIEPQDRTRLRMAIRRLIAEYL